MQISVLEIQSNDNKDNTTIFEFSYYQFQFVSGVGGASKIASPSMQFLLKNLEAINLLEIA